MNLNYNEIRNRIEIDIGKMGSKGWADLIGVSINVVSNIHGKAGKHYPSLQYVVAVARVTGKPIDVIRPKGHTLFFKVNNDGGFMRKLYNS